MRDLLTQPAWQAGDLGLPLPVDPHAVSVALPLWQHVIAYEENDPRLMEKLRGGYPRFFLHPFVRQLAQEAERDLAKPGETAWLFASRAASRRAAAFAGPATRAVSWRGGLEAVLTPPEAVARGKLAWRYFGEGVSSRRAEAVLQGRAVREGLAATAAQQLRSDLARRTGQHPDDVFLFPSGIAAMAAAHRIVRALNPGRPSLQFDLPYVDVLKVQQSCPAGVRMLDTSDPAVMGGLEPASFCAVFTEIASNPQLRTPPLDLLASRFAPHGVPVVADDTIATVANVDVYPSADLVTTSLTKFYSGTGNVLAGSLILNRSSPLFARLRAALELDYADDFFGEDAAVLAANARDFDVRMRQINRSADLVYEHLRRHPRVKAAWYPRGTSRVPYDAIKRSDGGYGGLLSLLVTDPPRNACRVYDRLRFCKGPSLGTNFSLVCPYMLLAYYHELGWTDRLGIHRHLLRLSVGIEPPEEIIGRLDQALQSCQP